MVLLSVSFKSLTLLQLRVQFTRWSHNMWFSTL